MYTYSEIEMSWLQCFQKAVAKTSYRHKLQNPFETATRHQLAVQAGPEQKTLNHTKQKISLREWWRC